MRFTRVLIFLIILPILTKAQNGSVDSLKSILATSPADSTKVDLLNSISTAVRGSSPEEAINFGTQAKELAQNINYQTGLAYALKNIGLGHYILGNYLEVDLNWKSSLEIFESIQDDLGSANLLSNLGVMYSDQGDDAKAIDYYLKSLRLAEKLGDSLRIASALGNIGYVYAAKEATQDQALHYFLQALAIGEIIGDQDIVGISASNLGDAYFEKKMYDSSLIYLNKSLVALANTTDAAWTLNLMGKVYAEKEEYQLAVDYQLRAITIATNFDAKYDLSEALLGLADTYQNMKEFRQAIPVYFRAQKIAKEVGADYILKDIYEGLAISYSNISDYKNAFEYQQLFDVVKDSIFNVETDDKIKTLQFSYEIDKKENEIEILEQTAEIEGLQIERQETVILAGSATVALLVVMGFILFNRYKYVQRTKKIIEIEKDKSQQLLLNILPEETARELEDNGSATPRHYDSVSVLFTDFKSFTKLAESISPAELVEELDTYFKAFDDIIDKHGLEKIKTIGDAYMCAGGLPTANKTHPVNTIEAGLAIQAYMIESNRKREDKGLAPWNLRIGIHTGPVVAGVVGKKKYAYDIWGDTVNVASRMESHGEAGKVNISAATYTLIKHLYNCTHRGKIDTKNKGKIDMYFVESEIFEIADI